MNAFIKLINNYQTASVCDTNGGRYLLPVDKDFLHKIGSYRYEYVYLWDAPEIFAIIDAYALNNNLQDYEQLELNQNGFKPRVTFECISRRDSEGAYYERKIWIKTQKAHSTDRHKRLAPTTYINIHNFFGSITFQEACNAFEVKYDINYAGGCLDYLIRNFATAIYSITGITIFEQKTGKIKYWTMGGISKAYYLKLFERQTKGIKYNDYVAQNEDFEIEMRLTHLLSKGILYCKSFNVEYANQYKFDKNSLFSHVGQDCPIFYPPINSTWQEYIASRPKRNKVNETYIITFKRLLLKVKPAFPNVLQPEGEICSDKNPPILSYQNKSFFAEHFETICKIYDIIDIEVKQVYRLKYMRDGAILEFTQKLFDLKKSLNGNTARRSVVKFLLNNLHGKFAQICLQAIFEYTTGKDGLLIRKVKSLRNTWKRGHFDFIRGAYIYSMAQREMLEELIRLPHPHKVNYIDTDCFFVCLDNSPRNVGDELGQFKEENFYKYCMFYAPKTYIGYNKNAEMIITCAGLNANEIKAFIYQEVIPYTPVWLDDIPDIKIPFTFTRRTLNGFARVTEGRTIGQGLTTKDIEEGGYINATDEI